MRLNGKPLEEVSFLYKNLGSKITADRGCERDLVHKMNDGFQTQIALRRGMGSRELWIIAKKCV